MIMTSAPRSGNDGFACQPVYRFPSRRMAEESSIVFISAHNQLVPILKRKFEIPRLKTGALPPW
jgi:hypothetical protein